MTLIAADCAIWTDWQIITQPKQCFKAQPGIIWATAAASCLQVAATKKTWCVCACLCEGGWGGLGLPGFHKHFERFSDWSSILFQQSTTKRCVLKSAALLLTASDSLLLKTHGCCSYSTVCHPYTVNKTLHLFCRHRLFSSETKSIIFNFHFTPSSHTHSNIGIACIISCWERLEWSPTSKATIRRKSFNSIPFRWQFIIAFSFSACLCIPLWFFPWMIQRGKRKEGVDGKWNRESICAYACVRGCVFSQERPGGHLVLEIGPHVQTTVHKHGC